MLSKQFLILDIIRNWQAYLKANKHIFFKHLSDSMRLIYAVLILFLALTTVQCQQIADEVIKAYDEAIKLNPTHPAVWSFKGEALFDLGNYDEALVALDEAIKLSPDDYASPWYLKGAVLFNQGNYDEALVPLDEAIKQYATQYAEENYGAYYADAWVHKGAVLFNQGNYDEAIAAFDEAIDLDSSYADAWDIKGQALETLGKTTEADSAFAKARELDTINAIEWRRISEEGGSYVEKLYTDFYIASGKVEVYYNSSHDLEKKGSGEIILPYDETFKPGLPDINDTLPTALPAQLIDASVRTMIKIIAPAMSPAMSPDHRRLVLSRS